MNLNQEMSYCLKYFIRVNKTIVCVLSCCFLLVTGTPTCAANFFKNLSDDEEDDCESVQSAAVHRSLLNMSVADSSGRHKSTIIIFLKCSNRPGLISQVQNDNGFE